MISSLHLELVAHSCKVMDFIAAHGSLKEKQARRFFRQVVAAIDYCHSLRVIHRDIKAENLLLDHRMRVKLIDFGLSNQWTPGGFLKTFCGSPTYTAPELIKRQVYEGPEVDIWALGVLLYVLVCGSLPFDGNSFQELFTKILQGDYEVPDFISSECRDLIGRMLVVDPKQRASLDQVREHMWVRMDGEMVPKTNPDSFQAPLSVEDFDQDVLEEAVQCGFDKDEIIEAVLFNTYDHASSTYYLLLSKRYEEGILKDRGIEDNSVLSPIIGDNIVIPPDTDHTTENRPDRSIPFEVIAEAKPYSPKTHRRHKTLGSSSEFDKSMESPEINKREHMRKKSSEGSIKSNIIIDRSKNNDNCHNIENTNENAMVHSNNIVIIEKNGHSSPDQGKLKIGRAHV